MTNKSNPFAEMFETFTQQMPAIDFNDAIEASKRSAEAFQEFNQAARSPRGCPHTPWPPPVVHPGEQRD